MSNYTKINNYTKLENTLKDVSGNSITFREEGANYIFEVNGKKYELAKDKEDLINDYNKKNDTLKITIETGQELDNLKNVVEVQAKLDGYITEFNDFADATRRRERNNVFDKKYKGPQYKEIKQNLKIAHKLIKNQLIQLKSQKEYTEDHPDLVDLSSYDFSAYDNVSTSMKQFLTRGSASDMKGDLDMIINNLKDAKLYQKYQDNAIEYKTEFTGILADIATNKTKISDINSMENYFQDVINGNIPNPAQDPFKPTNLADYQYLLSLKNSYPLISRCVVKPSNNNNTNDTTNGSALDGTSDLSNDLTIQDAQGDNFIERTGDAIQNGGIISGIGQVFKEGLSYAGIEENMTAKQKGFMRLAGVGIAAFAVFKLAKKVREKRKKLRTDKKTRKMWLPLLAVEGFSMYTGGGEIITGALGAIFNGDSRGAQFIGNLMKNGFNVDELMGKEQEGKTRPITTAYTFGELTPSSGVFKTDGGNLEYDADKYKSLVGIDAHGNDDTGYLNINKKSKNIMRKNFNKLETQNNKQEIFANSLAELGITKEDLEDPANAEKTLLEIAGSKERNDNSNIAKIDNYLEDRGYEITDEGRYEIYIDYEEGTDISQKIENRENNGRIDKVSNESLVDKTEKERAILSFEHDHNIKHIPSEFSQYEASIPDDETGAIVRLEELSKTATPPCFEYDYTNSENILLQNRDGNDTGGYETQLKSANNFDKTDLSSYEIDAIVGMANMIEKDRQRKLEFNFDSQGNLMLSDSTNLPGIEIKLNISNKTMPGFEENGQSIPFNSIEDMMDTATHTMLMMQVYGPNSSDSTTPFTTGSNILGNGSDLVYTFDETRLENTWEELKELGGERVEKDPGLLAKITTITAAGGAVITSLLSAGTLTPILIGGAALGLGIGGSVKTFKAITEHQRDSYYSDEDTTIPPKLRNANTHKNAYINFLNTVPGPNGDASYFSSAA